MSQDPAFESPHASQEPVLDEAALRQLARDTAPELVPVMIATFLQETEARVRRMVELRSSESLDELRHEAHTLKSSAGTFGARRVASRAREIERQCDEGDAERAGGLAAELPELLELSRAALSAHRPG